MSKPEDEKYRLTPLGLFAHNLVNEDDAKRVAEALELYLRRNNVAVAIEDNKMRFVQLEPVI